MKVQYIGNVPKLVGATALLHNGKLQLDRYPLGPPIELCNPREHPLCFGWHDFDDREWIEI